MLVTKISHQLFTRVFKDINLENTMVSIRIKPLHRPYVTEIHKRGKARENVHFRKMQCEQLQRLKKINEEQKKKIHDTIEQLQTEIKEITKEIRKMNDDK